MSRVALYAVVLAVGLMVLPAWAATDYFPVTANGSFDTYRSEGYNNQDDNRLGKWNQDIGWMAWNGVDANGTTKISVGDLSGQTLAQFAAGQTVVGGTLYFSLNNASMVGSYAVQSLRSGNTGYLREDGGWADPDGTFAVDGPNNNIGGSSQPYAFASMPAPFSGGSAVQGGLAGDYTPWITPSNSNVDAGGWSWTSGVSAANSPIVKKVGPSTLGWDGTRDDVGGWALQFLLGYGNGQGSTTMARAIAAGQLVNQDGDGNLALLSQSNAVASSPRPGSAEGNWYAVPLTLDLVNALISDPEMKGIVFNNFMNGVTGHYNNQAFGGWNSQGLGAYLALTVVPEPTTMILLALGGAALIRRRQA